MNSEVSYLRTSSQTNVDGDSSERQRLAVQRGAERDGNRIVREFNDPAVSGKDPIETRPGFAALLNYLDESGVRIVRVEDISRFARELMTQELGIALLQARGVRLLSSNGDDLTDSDDEFRVAIRQVIGVFAQLERTRLVKKMRGARDRKSAEIGHRVEGRQRDTARWAALRGLRTSDPAATYEQLSARLAGLGFLTLPPKARKDDRPVASYGGRPLSKQEISRMVKTLEMRA